MSKIVVNVAWPYANGTIHLGHVAGSLLPADLFSRYNRLIGNEVLMVGGSDMHGTPITISAEKAGMTPEQYAEKFHQINKKAIEDLGIQYSLYNRTHCQTHFEVTQKLFLDLKAKGYIYTKGTDQYYCPKCARFLPDRYVEGVCPKCGAEKTRSDQCDACGTTFETGDLLEPYCTLCGTAPEVRSTEHFFLKLSAFREPLLKYLEDKDYWRPNVKAFTKNWLEEGLHDRAITRDMSWGVPIPVEGWDGKVIYVWFDAVIGYLSASVEYSKMIGKPVAISIVEVRSPDLNAQLVAENIAAQIEKRISHRRAMKMAMQRAMKLGAKGIKCNCAGRLGGREIAGVEHYHEGTIPLQTLRADIDYGFAEAKTTYGRIGVKVWLYKGEVLTGGPRSTPVEAPRRDRRDRRDGDRRDRRDRREGGERRERRGDRPNNRREGGNR